MFCFVVAAIALEACSGEADTTMTSAPDGGDVADATPEATSDVVIAPDAPRDVFVAPYPALSPIQPAVRNSGGPVLHEPRLVPVFVNAVGTVETNTATLDPTRTQSVEYLQRYATSATWLAQLSEYGVGAATVGAPIVSAGMGLPSGTIQGTRLRAWIGEQVSSGAWGDSTGDVFYLVYLDNNRQVQLSSGSYTCRGVGGYHENVTLTDRRSIAYAIVPQCGEGGESLARVVSHELVEGMTDPFPYRSPGFSQPSNTDPPEGAWAIAYNGGEIGDMCQHLEDSMYFASDVGDFVQRSWSNAAALAGADPCVPSAPQAVYFNAFLDLPDVVTIMDRSNTRSVQSRGVVIPSGESRVIDVRLYSTGPTRSAWSVAAREVSTDGRSMLRLTWDRASGRNGDVLHLTITPREDVTSGRVFQVISRLGRSSTSWVGAVTTPF
jgi:hypothetical protein